MFASIWTNLIDRRDAVVKRNKGVVFLSTAREIYDLSSISYLCVNIPRCASGLWVHCAFSDVFASQAITPSRIGIDRLADAPFFRDREVIDDASAEDALSANAKTSPKLIRLASHRSEQAFLGYTREPVRPYAEPRQPHLSTDLTILGNYFHNHMLRRHVSDTAEHLLVSARELDCLEWAAQGKSAWEASVILGISERTVRFHLNSAREKLNCTTTTQAVAKAVSQELIPI